MALTVPFLHVEAEAHQLPDAHEPSAECFTVVQASLAAGPCKSCSDAHSQQTP